jgi:hypothetical protein
LKHAFALAKLHIFQIFLYHFLLIILTKTLLKAAKNNHATAWMMDCL